MLPVFQQGGLGRIAQPVAAGGGDPNYASTLIVMNMQGANNGTTFTDNAPSPGTWTAVGNAKTSTAQFIFGTSSGVFDGSGDAVSRSAEISIASTTSWTFEQWYRPDEDNYTGGTAAFKGIRIVEAGASILGYEYFSQAPSQRCTWGGRDGTSLALQDQTLVLLANTWYFVMMTNDAAGNVFTVYVDTGAGLTSRGTLTKRGIRIQDLGMRTGNTGSSPNNEFKGYVGPTRLTSGVVRSVATPTALFPTS